jgi:nitrogen fixation/metabolism regulation signal transduction histidine kinase
LDEVKEFVGGNISGHEEESEISKGIEGDVVVTTHVHLGDPDWAVVVELPVDEAYEDVDRELRLSLYVMSLCFVLAIAIGICLSRRITRPVKELRDATGEISKGNLDTEIDVKSGGEIGDLALSFNSMTRDLKKSKRKLEDYSRTLEGKVKERTNELMTINEALKAEIVERKNTEEALNKTMHNLQRFNRLAVNREQQMIELKKEVNDLLHSVGSQEKYRIHTQDNQ